MLFYLEKSILVKYAKFKITIISKETVRVRMATVDEYVLPRDVTRAYKDAPLTDQKHPSEQILSGKWKGYTPAPMPKKK